MASSSKPTPEVEEGMGFAVTPLSTCPHLSEPLPKPIDVKEKCAKCQDGSENWICLSCYEVNCGRHVKGDAMKHFEEAKHPLVLSFSDLSVWCYACENYVHNEKLEEVKKSAHASKFPA